MFIGSMIFLGIALAAAFISSGCAAVVRYATKSNALSVAVGGLALPAFILFNFVYWLATMEADDAPPGNVIVGTAVFLIVVTPITMMMSYTTVRMLSKRKT